MQQDDRRSTSLPPLRHARVRGQELPPLGGRRPPGHHLRPRSIAPSGLEQFGWPQVEHFGVAIGALDPRDLNACDKVLSTSTVLLNHTLDEVLANCRKARCLALIGPGAGCLPDVLFEAGVTTLGRTWITDTSGFKEAMHLGLPWSRFARKFALNATDWPGASMRRSV
ncbi:MAG: hypothetical protein IV094_11210 [Vitreoscilla sp.]|nr:hypothetical protein [Vitreoscilla sp.]